MIDISNIAMDEYAKSVKELYDLNSKPVLTKRDEQRQVNLIAVVSALKAGASQDEVRRWQRAQLLREAGLPKDPERARGRLAEEVEAEWRRFLYKGECDPARIPKDSEVRTITAGNEAGQQSITYTEGALGGYSVPTGIAERTYDSLKLADDILNELYSNCVYTNTGATVPFPSVDDVTTNSTFLGEGVQGTGTQISNFGTVQLYAYTARSQPVPFSIEFEMDSAFPLGAVLEKVFAGRLARGIGQKFATGSGVNQPTGLITAIIAAGISPVIASGSSANDGSSSTGSNSIGTKDLATLKHNINPAYQRNGVWFMNDATLQSLEALTDKNGRPIVNYFGWQGGITGEFDTVPKILGRPVAVCPSFPSIASGNNSVVFGDPSYFITRRIPSSMFIRRYSQLPQLVERGMIAAEQWLRCDSNLICPDVNYAPFAILQNHS